MTTLQAQIYIPEHLEQYYPELKPQTVMSSGLDLVVPRDIQIGGHNKFQLIDFEIVIKSPAGYHALLLPRSSTFKHWNLIQTNSIGLIDEDYCGPEDTVKMSVLWIPTTAAEVIIPAGTRLAQIIFEKKTVVEFSRFLPGGKSRGGIGSTGKGV